MKKTIIALTLAIVAAAPAHAINAHYRDQLIRSGCTQVSVSEGCDIHKTKEQNARAAQKGQDFSKFVGLYSVFAANGQRIGNKAIAVTEKTVRYNGHAVERPRVVNGVLLFSVDLAQYSITGTRGNELGNWLDDRTNTGGTIGR